MSAIETTWEPTPWHATQRARWAALVVRDDWTALLSNQST